MIAKTVAVLAMAGSAAAFAPTMSLSNGQTRREAIGAAAAGAAVVTALPLSANAKSVWPSNKAPIITMFDGRGCTEHKNREYTGPKTGGIEDELCVKVQFERIQADETNAFGILKEVLSQLKK